MKIDIIMPGGVMETDLDVSAKDAEELCKALNQDWMVFQKTGKKPGIVNLANACVVRLK